MFPLLCRLQIKLTALVYHFSLELDVMGYYIQKSKLHRTVVDYRRHIGREIDLQIRLLIKKRYHSVCVGLFFKLDDAAHTVSIRLVDYVGYTAKQVLIGLPQIVYFR